MPKTTEAGTLKRALRNTSVMTKVIADAFESGNGNRASAALGLLDEFQKDVHAVLDPLMEAQRIAHETQQEPEQALQS